MSQEETKTYRVMTTSVVKVPIERPTDEKGNTVPIEVTVGANSGGLTQEKIEFFKYALEDRIVELADELREEGASDWRSQIKGAKRLGKEIISIMESLKAAGGGSKTIRLD